MLASLFDVFSSASISTQPDGSLLIQSSYLRLGAWFLAFLILAPLSLVLLRLRKRVLVRFAVAGCVVSLAILILVIPGVMAEKIHITKDRLTGREGFWFSPTHCDIDLTGLAFIRERSSKGSFHQSKVFWLFKWRDGRTFDLVLPDLLAANQDAAVNYLHEQGIEVVGAGEELPTKSRTAPLPPSPIHPRPASMGMRRSAPPRRRRRKRPDANARPTTRASLPGSATASAHWRSAIKARTAWAGAPARRRTARLPRTMPCKSAKSGAARHAC